MMKMFGPLLTAQGVSSQLLVENGTVEGLGAHDWNLPF